MIADYLDKPYVAGARGPDEFDCYGLLRWVRAVEYGKGWMPAFDGKGMKRLAQKTMQQARNMKPVSACAGAAACAWNKGICVHVGVVVEADNRMWILETEEQHGIRVTRIDDFKKRYMEVTFYD